MRVFLYSVYVFSVFELCFSCRGGDAATAAGVGVGVGVGILIL